MDLYIHSPYAFCCFFLHMDVDCKQRYEVRKLFQLMVINLLITNQKTNKWIFKKELTNNYYEVKSLETWRSHAASIEREEDPTETREPAQPHFMRQCVPENSAVHTMPIVECVYVCLPSKVALPCGKSVSILGLPLLKHMWFLLIYSYIGFALFQTFRIKWDFINIVYIVLFKMCIKCDRTAFWNESEIRLTYVQPIHRLVSQWPVPNRDKSGPKKGPFCYMSKLHSICWNRTWNNCSTKWFTYYI